jgi:hypothetical protein
LSSPFLVVLICDCSCSRQSAHSHSSQKIDRHPFSSETSITVISISSPWLCSTRMTAGSKEEPMEHPPGFRWWLPDLTCRFRCKNGPLTVASALSLVPNSIYGIVEIGALAKKNYSIPTLRAAWNSSDEGMSPGVGVTLIRRRSQCCGNGQK